MVEWNSILSRIAGRRPPPRRAQTAPPSLPVVRYSDDSAPADWLRESLQTFAESVASFLPGHFEAYIRIHHPFGDATGQGPTQSWAEVSGRPLESIAAEDAEALAFAGGRSGQALVGRLPPHLAQLLVAHLRSRTSTPDQCFFALWEGHGDSPVAVSVQPTLDLPHRRYHLFSGPIDGAAVNYALDTPFHLGPNLWWPADQAWCVATEVDSAWTWVGGTRECIEAMLDDPGMESVRTTAGARW